MTPIELLLTLLFAAGLSFAVLVGPPARVRARAIEIHWRKRL